MSKEPVVFLHGINMTAYDGYEANIHAGGFKFAKENGFGGEIYNFRNVNGRYYGHVEIMPREISGELTPISIRLQNLGASMSAPSLDGVLVVWTAPCRDFDGREVVGWYRNATLHRDRVYPTGKLKKARKFKHPDTGKQFDFDYRVEAKASDCHLLHPEERVLRIPNYPKSVKGVPGQFPVYYPLLTQSDEGKEVSKRVLAFVNDGVSQPSKSRRTKKPSSGRQQDPELRKKIEIAAVKCVLDHFGNGRMGLGYEIISREEENVGYDLLMNKGDVTLCVEVKGRSIDDVVADFSPNESRTIRAHETGKFEDGDYRVCIVTDALEKRGKRRLHHFSWWPEKKKWIKVDGSEELYFHPSGATLATLDPTSRSKDDRDL